MSGVYFAGKYRESVDEVLKFLGGNYDKILKDLEEKMQEASDDLEFEKAIEYRELLHSVKQIAQKQKITDTGGEDRDIVALAREREDAVVQVFFIRNGRLIGRDHFYLRIAQEMKMQRSSPALSSSFMPERHIFRAN